MGLFDKLNSLLGATVSKQPQETQIIDRRTITPTQIDDMQKMPASDRYRDKIHKKYYGSYPVKPFISLDRERNTNWLEQAEIFPKQTIIPVAIMTPFNDGLLPGHIYLLYWIGKNGQKRVPSYFEYKYGIEFDQAGVAYPDENWTWDDLTEASQKIYDATGKYGYMAYCDEQLGYWNFVYQNGGYILNEDKTAAGFDNQATIDAMKFYIGLQDNEWCPDQTYFAETAPGNAFFSEQGAMFLEGTWNLLYEMKNYPEMQGKWDVAVLPKSPNPASGDGRATISNGLCYSTSAKNQDNETVMNFLKWLGSEEAQKLQSSYGAAISGYEGTEQAWIDAFDQFDYKLNVQACIDMFDYSVQSVNDATRPVWKSKVNDEMLKIYGGQVSVDEGLKNCNDIINQAIAEG